MSYDDVEPDYTEIIKILNKYELPLHVHDDVVETDDKGVKKTKSVLIDTFDPIDQQEIAQLMAALYIAADRKSPTGKRTDDDITKLTEIQNILETNLEKKKKIENKSEEYSIAWQAWAKRQHKNPEKNNVIGGKSRVFRRKNKTTRSKSRRNAQRTRRHRKSSTRRSTRK
jgi:hypothetical protein